MKAVFGLPLCVLARRTICGVYTFLVSLPKAEKKEKKEGSLKNANAIYQPGNQFLEDLCERLAKQHQHQGECSEGNEQTNEGCQYCGFFGHKEDKCTFKMSMRKVKKAKEQETDAGPKPSTSLHPMNNKVRIERNGLSATLYTPAWLDEYRFP